MEVNNKAPEKWTDDDDMQAIDDETRVPDKLNATVLAKINDSGLRRDQLTVHINDHCVMQQDCHPH